jgi:uncharacterized membrane protein YfcA
LSAFDCAVAFTAVAAGAVASIAGFGVGSLLTPLLTVPYGAKLAVALVAFPHAIAGMVGNQGGIRSAGLLAFELSPREFIATAAAIALVVDAVRTPLYMWTAGPDVLAALRIMAIATAGVVAGTFAGSYILLRLPAAVFRCVIGAVLLTLGIWMLT